MNHDDIVVPASTKLVEIDVNCHCKGCAHHHNAGHPKDSKLARVFNDFCVRFGKPAVIAVGECKLKNGRVEKSL